MSDYTRKGKWCLSIVDSTKQWSIEKRASGDGGGIHGGNSYNQVEEVRDLIDLLETYLILRKSNYNTQDNE